MRADRMTGAYLFRKVLKHRNVAPALHVQTLELADLLEFSFLRIFVQRFEQLLVEDEVGVAFMIMDLDVCEVGVYAKGEVGRQCPWCGGPSKKRGFGVINEWERDGD